MSETVELPRTGPPVSGLGDSWRVIVLNDDHNTFDHVAQTLARVIPGISIEQGLQGRDQWQGGKMVVLPGSWIMVYPQFIEPSPSII